MGSWRRMGAFLGLVAEDEQHSGDYDYERGYPERDYTASRPQRYSDEGTRGRANDVAEPVTQGALAVQLQPASRLTSESSTAARPLTVKLTGFGEARIIGERYRDGASVILDMTDLSDADARRVVDFAAGLAFALRGSIDKVTTRVFMLLPPDMDLSADARRAFAGNYVAR